MNSLFFGLGSAEAVPIMKRLGRRTDVAQRSGLAAQTACRLAFAEGSMRAGADRRPERTRQSRQEVTTPDACWSKRTWSA